jgi:NitT/TauT family transport system permease protein
MILQSVPIVAITPVIALAIGRTAVTAIVIAAIICFFPVMVNAVRGLRSVSDESLELMHVLDASGRQELRLLRLPSSLPYLFTGLRVAATICFPGAMIAEWLTAARGLGYYIVDMQVRYRTDLVWAGLVTATLTGVVLFTVVSIIERRVIRWHETDVGFEGGA